MWNDVNDPNPDVVSEEGWPPGSEPWVCHSHRGSAIRTVRERGNDEAEAPARQGQHTVQEPATAASRATRRREAHVQAELTNIAAGLRDASVLARVVATWTIHRASDSPAAVIEGHDADGRSVVRVAEAYGRALRGDRRCLSHALWQQGLFHVRRVEWRKRHP
jgi:hypothetical protein